MDRTRSNGRAETPFALRITENGTTTEVTARAVIDASGTYRTTNSLGSNGLDPLGLEAVADHVTGTVDDVLYQGSVADSLVVARALDTIVFGDTNQIYNGAARIVTATADSGTSVALTYDGSATAPVDAGTYSVTGVVNAANWTATNTTTLTITAANLAPVFNALGVQTAYVGAAMSFVVG